MKFCVARLCLALFGALFTVQAGTVDVISNGTFEGGNLSGWTTATLTFGNVSGACNNGFAAQSVATGCVAGTAPAFGSYAAYSSTSFPPVPDDSGEYVNRLDQNFVVPTGTITSATLGWADAATWSGTGTFRGVVVYAQILSGGTNLFIADSVVNPGSSSSTPWANHSADVTSILSAHLGETLTLRLAGAAFYDMRQTSPTSSATTLNTGFDNASLNITTLDTGVPEPGSWALAVLGLGALATGGKRLRRPMEY